MASTLYRLPDEPVPGALSGVAVNPVFPLLAMMLGGAWLGWPWLAVNAFAIGSPTRWKELALVLAGLFGSGGLILGLVAAAGGGLVRGLAISFWVLAVIVWKLFIAYRVYILQARTFGVYEYYGGRVQNGLVIALIGSFFGRRLVIGGLKGAWLLLFS
jgi:hypothetical protein